MQRRSTVRLCGPPRRRAFPRRRASVSRPQSEPSFLCASTPRTLLSDLSCELSCASLAAGSCGAHFHAVVMRMPQSGRVAFSPQRAQNGCERWFVTPNKILLFISKPSFFCCTFLFLLPNQCISRSSFSFMLPRWWPFPTIPHQHFGMM